MARLGGSATVTRRETAAPRVVVRPRSTTAPEGKRFVAAASGPGDDKASFHVTALLDFFDELRAACSMTTKTGQRRPGMGGAAPPNSSIAGVF
jgi:hypothetical protein